MLKTLSLSLSLSLSCVGLISPDASAQSVTIHERVIADWGANGHDLFEPGLAATRTRRLAVYRSVGNVMRAASATSQSATWRAEDILPPGGGFVGQDATVAVVDPSTETFVVFAISGAFGGTPRLMYCTFAPASGFSDWVTAYQATPEVILSLDKPWVVRRTASDFFVFYFTGSNFWFLRSASGTSWTGLEPALLATSEGPVQGRFCAQPAVAADGRILVAYASEVYGAPEFGKVRILVGEVGGTGVSFSSMRRANGSLVEFQPRSSQNEVLPAPSGISGNPAIISKKVPYLVCDPTDWRRAYVVYQDVAADDPEDVNVYLARLQADANGDWDLLSNQPIHDEVTSTLGVRADQIIPTAIVDGAGRIHVLYYDNRPACGSPGFSTQYDAWHALSTDQGGQFTLRNLRTSCDAGPAMDLGLQAGQVLTGWSPREYNGIAAYQSGTQSRVWVVYAGTASEEGDDPQHPSVLFGQQIVVSNEP